MIKKSKESIRVINILSVLIPIVVAVILGIRERVSLGDWTHALPKIIALINSLTAILLMYGLLLVKQKDYLGHQRVMTMSFGLGAAFLICYVLYHISNENTKYGGEGTLKTVYFIVLISHVIISFLVLPLVLRAFYYGLVGEVRLHRKFAKWAYPFWLYVSITGVIAYVMIAPYYSF